MNQHKSKMMNKRNNCKQVLQQMQNLLDWRRQAVGMLRSALNGHNAEYLIFALRFTSRFFFVRGEPSIALQLIKKALGLCLQKNKVFQQLRQDALRYCGILTK
jgi:hypothetical protein